MRFFMTSRKRFDCRKYFNAIARYAGMCWQATRAEKGRITVTFAKI
jgi:hypothetical protein